MNAFGFMNTELTVDDLLEVSISGGNTKSTLRTVVEDDGSVQILDLDSRGNLYTRLSRFIEDGYVCTECYDEDGNLHDWGSRAAITVRSIETKEIHRERYNHGSPVHTRLSVPLKSEFDSID